MILIAACTKKNPSASCADGVCSDPNFPFCDVDGVIGGEPSSCIAVSCTTGEFGACDGDNVLTCNAAGNGYDTNACTTGCSADQMGCDGCTPNTTRCVGSTVETCGADGKVASTEPCAISCIDAPAPHCAYLDARYLPNVCDTPSTAPPLKINNPGSYDTDDDANCSAVVAQTGGPSICVVRAPTIELAATATLLVISSVQGSEGRALALVADDRLEIAGTLDASGSLNLNGPGGGHPISTPNTTSDGKGAGGAGFQTAGGPGGDLATDGGANNGGAALEDPASKIVFEGGPSTSTGGGGGGALLLVACRGTVIVSGTVSTNGGGGAGGTPSNSPIVSRPGGGGGGAGGYIVLQGLGVTITGSMFANGGAGASGGAQPLSNGKPGADGQRSDSAAAAGGASVQSSGAGGDGGLDGVTTLSPGKGKHATGTALGGGGGGGSVGFIQTYTPAGVSISGTAQHLSPQLQPNATQPTR